MATRETDLEVLATLARNGSDLTKPAHTIHFLYFKSMDAANSAAMELKGLGYETLRVGKMPATSLRNRLFGPRSYSCIAETHAVPSEPNVFVASGQMETIAAKLGGRYDGWEASVEK